MYSGHTESEIKKDWQPANPANSTHAIPMAELTRPDPILYYAEVPLFDSELDDNGSSSLLTRIVSLSYCRKDTH
jgi:type 2A phosphatase activator TIP41